ncbi:MAG: hypothetical protein K6T71_05845 [Candidatus Bipolaricaulota bacterium]|nr:hypothetical protein [Candidatus Bipolaricaulota bacterium]
MPKWVWLTLIGLVIVGGVVFLWVWQASAPSPERYRAGVIEVLQGRGELDPGLAFLLRGVRVDLDCQDERLCTRGENFTVVYEIGEEYENLLGDYYGRICYSGRIRPSTSDAADHQKLCGLLDALFKEVRGIKTKATLALQFLQRNPSEEVHSLLVGLLQRILEHRERVLQIETELKQIPWLEPALTTKNP